MYQPFNPSHPAGWGMICIVDLQVVIFLSGSNLRHKGTTIEQKKAE